MLHLSPRMRPGESVGSFTVAKNLDDVAKDFGIRDATPTDREALSSHLGLPHGATDSFRVRYLPPQTEAIPLHASAVPAWVLDIATAGGRTGLEFRVTGLEFLFANGGKKKIKGTGTRDGLLLPTFTPAQLAAMREQDAPVYSPIGIRNTLALTWLGLPTIGRLRSSPVSNSSLSKWCRAAGFITHGRSRKRRRVVRLDAIESPLAIVRRAIELHRLPGYESIRQELRKLAADVVAGEFSG